MSDTDYVLFIDGDGKVWQLDGSEPPKCLNDTPVPDHLHGSMFRNFDCMVASPPCQEFSYMAMPWKRGKQIAAALRGDVEFPDPYTGSRTIPQLTALFDACFRIQREACEAAGRHIPMVVENVRGAIPWVGRSAWNYGSFHLWGDVPALMPFSRQLKQAGNRMVPDGRKGKGSWFGDYQAQKEQRNEGIKQGGDWFSSGLGCGLQRHFSSRSQARKAASAQIAKIPFALASHIARVYKPETSCKVA